MLSSYVVDRGIETAMNYFVDLLICPDCQSQIYGENKEGLSCKECHRIYDEKEGILNLLPSDKGEHTEIEERDIQVFDDIRGLYKKINQFQGARKIVGDYSLTKIEDTNFELIKPYLDGKKVLEVGCGRGYLTALMSRSASVAAFDISKGSLEYARELGNLDSNVFSFQGNVYSIPFEAETFDIVVATEVLEHLPGLDKAMKEIHRVLKKDGTVVASVPNTIMYFYPVVLLFYLRKVSSCKRLLKLIKRQTDASPDQYHRPFLPRQFRNLFEKNGFEVTKQRTSILYFWRVPYEQIILWGDRHFPTIMKYLVKLIIRSGDVILDREIPLVKWIGTRQHILARKVT